MTPTTQDVGKVLLVNSAGYFLTANTFVPDNSLASLAGALRSAGVAVEIVDFQGPREVGQVMDATDRAHAEAIVEGLRAGQPPSVSLVRAYHEDRRRGERAVLQHRIDSLLASIERDRVGLVGFKLWAGEGLVGAIAMATAVRREFPGVRLAAGGPAVKYGAAVFERLTTVFDELVTGDGEDAILRLATGSSVPTSLGVSGQQALDRVPMPVYDVAAYPRIEELFRLRILDESRGCHNRCAFCAHPHLNGEQVRERTPALVVDEIERILERDGVRHFRLSGSNPRWSLVRAIGQELRRRRLDVRWSVFSSMNNVCAADLPWLARTGLSSVFFGIESGDDEILRRAHHKHNGGADHIVSVCETAMASGIFVAVSLIFPSPGETEQSRVRSLRLVERIFSRHRHGSALVMPALLTPGSRWWDRPEHFGFALEDGLGRDDYVLRGLTLSNDFLLPRDAWSDYGYSLDGRRMPELLAECEAFTRDVGALGVPVHVDDTAFMLSDLGGIEPATHKTELAAALIVGGARRLTSYVQTINDFARSRESARPLSLRGDSAQRTEAHARAQ